LVEQLICNQLVGGSSPSIGSKWCFSSRKISLDLDTTGGAPQLERWAGL
jgi:hypothetical protein